MQRTRSQKEAGGTGVLLAGTADLVAAAASPATSTTIEWTAVSVPFASLLDEIISDQIIGFVGVGHHFRKFSVSLSI
jgi:hypothetical protein